MPPSFQDTDRVPERWKTWAMSTRSEPRLPGLEDLRDPGDRELGAVGRRADLLRDDGRAAVDELDRQVLGLEVALLVGREVAGELRLRRPLELQADLRRLGRRRAAAELAGASLVAGCRGGRRSPAAGVAGAGVAVEPEHAANSTAAADTSPRTRVCFLMPLLCCGAPPGGAPSSSAAAAAAGRRNDTGSGESGRNSGAVRHGSRRAASGLVARGAVPGDDQPLDEGDEQVEHDPGQRRERHGRPGDVEPQRARALDDHPAEDRSPSRRSTRRRSPR